MQQILETSCFRYKKNTWHVESSYIWQPPKYLIILLVGLDIFTKILPRMDVPYLWIWLLYTLGQKFLDIFLKCLLYHIML